MLSSKYKLRFYYVLISALAISLLAGVGFARPAAALIEESCPDGALATFPGGSYTPQEYNEKCADHKTGSPTLDSVESAGGSGGGTTDADCTGKDAAGNDVGINQETCGIVAYLIIFINVLSAVVGVVIVIMVAVGGIQYSTARDNPQAIAAAKGRIVNALLALVFYLMGFALLQWLVPGGIL